MRLTSPVCMRWVSPVPGASVQGGSTLVTALRVTIRQALDSRRNPVIMQSVRIAVLGLGLIGGSIALALRRAGVEASIVAWTPSGLGPAAAAATARIDQAAASLADAVEGADLVVLAAPPLDCLRLLDELPRDRRHRD